MADTTETNPLKLQYDIFVLGQIYCTNIHFCVSPLHYSTAPDKQSH